MAQPKPMPGGKKTIKRKMRIKKFMSKTHKRGNPQNFMNFDKYRQPKYLKEVA